MQEMITISSEHIPLVDSRLMADRLDVRHRDIIRNILNKYESDFIEFGSFARYSAKPVGDLGGRPQDYYLLNEDQCYLLLTYIKNTPKARNLKKKLIAAFKKVRAQLANRDLARLDGKEVRKAETDSIKLLVEYASASGSKSASHYYANVTRMTNSLLGIDTGARDGLDANQLKQVSILEVVVDIAIRDGVKAEMPYKDIYQLAKERASHVVQAIGVIGGEL